MASVNSAGARIARTAVVLEARPKRICRVLLEGRGSEVREMAWRERRGIVAVRAGPIPVIRLVVVPREGVGVLVGRAARPDLVTIGAVGVDVDGPGPPVDRRSRISPRPGLASVAAHVGAGKPRRVERGGPGPVSYTHLTLPTTPYV